MRKFHIVFAALVFMLVCMGNTTNTYAKDDSLEKVLESGKLIVGTAADNPPKEFIIMEDGKEKIVGFDIDVAERIAEELGVELEIVNMSFDGLIPSIQNNEFDMAIAGFNPTEERKQVISFSDPYHDLPFIILIKADRVNELNSIEALAGLEVGAQKGSTQETILNEYISDANAVSLGKLPEVIAEINAGTIDAGVVSYLTGRNYLEIYPDLAIADITIDVPPEKTAQAIAFPKGSDALIERVNEIIAELKADGTITMLLEKNIELAKADGSSSTLSTFAPYFVRGALTTVGIAAVCVVFGTLLGIVVALIRLSNKWISKLALIYIQVLRGTPALLQVFIFYFGISSIVRIPSIQLFGINIARLIPGCIALSINSSAYVAEIIRSGINAVDKGQKEAGYSLGLKPGTTMKEIILPQAIRNILPALGNEFASMIKETSLLSVIAVSELMFVADTVKAATYRTMESLYIAAAIYLLMTLIVSWFVSRMEKKLSKSRV